MLTHIQIWRAIDTLAARQGLSPSGLARLAGLDPTTFNKSKRGDAGGKLRWPSTESVSKILAATGASVADFVALIGGEPDTQAVRLVPLLALAEAGGGGHFDQAGLPAGPGWEEIIFPEQAARSLYALEIGGDALLPVYRDGDRILVSPSSHPRRGDRVVVKIHAGGILAGQLSRLTAQRLDLKSFNAAEPDRGFALSEIAFVHRIIWASQ